MFHIIISETENLVNAHFTVMAYKTKLYQKSKGTALVHKVAMEVTEFPQSFCNSPQFNRVSLQHDANTHP